MWDTKEKRSSFALKVDTFDLAVHTWYHSMVLGPEPRASCMLDISYTPGLIQILDLCHNMFHCGVHVLQA